MRGLGKRELLAVASVASRERAPPENRIREEAVSVVLCALSGTPTPGCARSPQKPDLVIEKRRASVMSLTFSSFLLIIALIVVSICSEAYIQESQSKSAGRGLHCNTAMS